MEFETVVGLEVHCQLSTRTKLFCPCASDFTLEPNVHVCPGCLGMPGAVPVLNERALEYAAKTALALNCTVRPEIRFERKHYFYPDLPAGFQTSQLDGAVGHSGWLDIPAAGGGTRRVGINRIQLEEDAGKLVHNHGRTQVDLNRAGSTLVEIVSEPDLRSAAEARAYLELLRLTLLYLGVSDVNMEEGSLRCDANVSVRPAGQTEYGTRHEVKNLNSFRALEAAVEVVAERLRQASRNGERITQSTWGYDLDSGRVTLQREKETAADYRYLHAPDLPPLRLEPDWVAGVRGQLPELPGPRRARLQKTHDLSDAEAGTLVQDAALASYFELAAGSCGSSREAASWVLNDLARLLNDRKLAPAACPVPPRTLAEIIKLVRDRKINVPTGRKILERLFDGETLSPAQLVAKEGLAQVSDDGELASALEDAIATNMKQALDIQNGKTAAAMWFVGAVMKATGGKADPAKVTALVAKRFGLDPALFVKKKKTE